MKTKKIILLICAASMSLTSCINDNYDLSNIDTTVKLDVDNLTIPLNLDKMVLDKVMNLDEESQIKKVKDPITGNEVYAVLEEGEFHSDVIKIPSFSTTVPTINKIDNELPLQGINKELKNRVDAAIDAKINEETEALAAKAKDEAKSQIDLNLKKLEGTPLYPTASEIQAMYDEAYKKIDDQKETYKAEAKKEAEKNRKDIEKSIWLSFNSDERLAYYSITSQPATFTASSDKVDKALRSVEKVKVNSNLNVSVRLTNLDDILTLSIDSVELVLPKGLAMTVKENKGTYNPETGILFIKKATLEGGKYDLSATITEINVKKENGIEFNKKDGEPGSFKFDGEVYIKSGNINIYKSTFKNGKTFFDLPYEASYTCSPSMSNIEIKSFTGSVKYEVEGVKVNPIEITDIPGILSNDNTKLFLDNPQIYLAVTNPLASQGLYAEANLQLTPLKNGTPCKPIRLDDNGDIKVEDSDNCYILSPEDPSKKYEGYEEAEWHKYSGLSRIISGDDDEIGGIPERINIDISKAEVPEQHVEDFKLDQTIGTVDGKYLFYAPITLSNHSVIVYETIEDGWSTDEEIFDKINISLLKVSATLSSKLPLGARATITPLGKDGQPLDGVSFSIAEIKPNLANQSFVLEQKSGEIKGLDGIKVQIRMPSDGSSPLMPDQTLDLKDIKVTVSGSYLDEL